MVPVAEDVTGYQRPELLVLMAETARDIGEFDGWHRLLREAVALLGPETEPLLASRVYGALAVCDVFTGETVDEAEAVRRAVELAGDEPSAHLARAETARAQHRLRHLRCADSLRSAERAEQVARTVECGEALVDALRLKAMDLFYLGRVSDAIQAQADAVQVAREARLHGRTAYQSAVLSWVLCVAGDLDRAVDVAESSHTEALAQGLSTTAALCGVMSGHVWTMRGRFGAAAIRIEQVIDLGLDAENADLARAELHLARGEPDEVAPYVRRLMDFQSQVVSPPFEDDVDAQVSWFLMMGSPDEALSVAGHDLENVAESDSPLRHACAAYNGFRALAVADRATDDAGRLEGLSRRSLARAREGLHEEWAESWHGVRLAMAEAYARRLVGDPAVDELRVAVRLTEPFGAYSALEPRLLMAEELLSHSEREEGKELLTAVWSDAQAMGAGDFERRAFKLATRTRVPLPHEATESGPLARLTPRELEVLDLLAEGARNRDIADALFITEKTASVHVSNVLGKLGVPNRGAAAALARRLG